MQAVLRKTLVGSSRTMQWLVRVPWVGEMRNAFKILMETTERNGLLRRRNYGLGDNIRLDGK